MHKEGGALSSRYLGEMGFWNFFHLFWKCFNLGIQENWDFENVLTHSQHPLHTTAPCHYLFYQCQALTISVIDASLYHLLPVTMQKIKIKNKKKFNSRNFNKEKKFDDKCLFVC